MNCVTKCLCKLRLNPLYDHSKRASEISDVTVGMKKRATRLHGRP